MRTTGDQHLVKKINKSIILQLIRRNSPLSRAKLSEISGLNKGTVSSLVNELLSEQLAYETGPGESSGGRRPVMVVFNQSAGFAVGIDLRVHEAVAVLTDLLGVVVLQRQIPLGAKDPESVIGVLTAMISGLIADAPSSPLGIVGIGIGVPGLVDAEGGVLFAPNLGWRDVPLGAALVSAFGLPVTIDNEANAGALGELEFGAGQQLSNLVYVSVGTGIGTGMIMGGDLFKGASGYSGETGHISIQVDGKPCTCGNRGCWELYASEQALAEEAGISHFAEAARQAEAGAERAVHALEQIGRYLGVGIANIINVMNPQSIIIGNEIIHAAPWLEQAVRTSVEERALSFHRSGLSLEFARLGDRSTVLGAAFSAISGFFSKDRVQIG
ncbi:ROK family protein [Paenibacillus gansuensis]|uniref:ROK family protein n=1 Tax=Paenibacillus gansuensis TaxID=306542 RepID=A0ABW5PB50_9BACL